MRPDDIIFAPIRRKSDTVTSEVVQGDGPTKYRIWCNDVGGFWSVITVISVTYEECERRLQAHFAALVNTGIPPTYTDYEIREYI